jgi:diguanylate cyclase (GGDEF)-like protein/PAS domain S-box-containing protein
LNYDGLVLLKPTTFGRIEAVHQPLSWEPTAAFLKFAIGITMAGELIYFAIVFGLYPSQWHRTLGPALLFAACLISLFFLALKHVRTALVLMAAGSWSAITLMVYLNGGIRVPLAYAYPLLIIVAGWLLGAQAVFIVTSLTCTTLIGMIAAEQNGLLPHEVTAPLPLFGLVQVFVCILSAGMVYFLVNSYKKRLSELSLITQNHAQRSQELEAVRSELFHAQAVSKVGSWVYDIKANAMRMSDVTCRILGINEGDAISHAQFHALTIDEDRQALIVAWQAALEGEVFDHEHRLQVGDKTRWVRQRAEVIFSPQGEALRAVGSLQDITRRKLVDLALQQSEKRYSTAFRSSPVAFSITTAERGLFLEANDNFERDFGWTREDLLGRYAVETGLWPDNETRLKWVAAIMETGRVRNFETVWMHKNGQRRDVSASGEVIEIDDQQCLLVYSTDITERKLLDLQIQSLAFFDPLTQLPNRRMLMDRLTQTLVAATRHPRQGALLFMDLDNFKTLNDTYGHAQGDMLLQQVAQRLKACVREGDTVARLGGDEFVVMLDGLSDHPPEAAAQTEAVAEKILSVLNQTYQLGVVSHHSTLSIGVTLFGLEPEGIEEPLKRADLAMYQAKNAGRNTIRFFDPDMQSVVDARVKLEAGIRQALTEQQFVLHYQPQLFGRGYVMGAEVLVRWLHPKRGLVSPAEFIPLAEESGLILPLGQWVLETACLQLKAWSDLADCSHLTLAVNVSSRQFHQKDFVDQVLQTLERTGADPSRLKLELTETLLVTDINNVIERMSRLKSRGVSFSLDDFGTGFSSLAYLKRMPLSQLKIDQSFVRDILIDPNDVAIARMVVTLAETMGLQVIAEGVETQAQIDALSDLGCQHFQGYFFSRPLPVDQFQAYLRSLPTALSTASDPH